MPIESLLDLSIEFGDHHDRPRVSIGFRNKDQASQYHCLISERPFTKKMSLDPQIYHRFVSVRLPSRVVKIEAISIEDKGFCLCTNDAKFARQWKDALMLWEFTSGSGLDLHLKRDVNNETLDSLLLIDQQHRQRREPNHALASASIGRR